jgi:uncharacterized protein YdaU (DUF1376 family)
MSEGLPWMKLFVGREALRISGLSLDACGAYFRLILLTWERGPVKTTTAELFLGCTLASLGEAFADLLTVQNDVVSVDSVERERGARTGVSKQAASAANARWEKERMRPHYEAHTERNAERNAKKKEKESKEGEEEREKKVAPLALVWPSWAGDRTKAKWDEFKAYKLSQFKFKYRSAASEQAAVNTLGKYYTKGEQCFDALELAMAKGYMFPLDPATSPIRNGVSAPEPEPVRLGWNTPTGQ